MQTYLVGGAVRDKLLGLDPKDKDWVVVDSSVEEMLALGYQKVGASFAVFLHPETREEYALARTEESTGPGYEDFQTKTEGVSLIEDLKRRDLTINSMAIDTSGTLIDPFGGEQDLKEQILCHTSWHFCEDPLRVLRVARFAARYNFSVHAVTKLLMKEMVREEMLSHLTPERVWIEIHKALGEKDPVYFFDTLEECGALKVILPEIDCLFGIPQVAEHHPEIDTWVHTMMVLEEACKLSPDPVVRFAALVHDVGKGTTPKEEWPKHHGHEERGEKIVEALCERLRVPNEYSRLAIKCARYHTHLHNLQEMRPNKIYDLIKTLGGLHIKTFHTLTEFCLVCEADKRGRLGKSGIPYPNAYTLMKYAEACHNTNIKSVVERAQARGTPGNILGDQIRQARIQSIREIKLKCEQNTGGES